MSPLVKLAILAALAAVTATAYFGWRGQQREIGRAEIRAEWNAERAQLQAQVQRQRDENIDLQRAAEKRYVVQAEVRERVITQTITEVRHETASLAACTLTAGARRLLQHAADCASGDPAAACGPGQPLRPASAAR